MMVDLTDVVFTEEDGQWIRELRRFCWHRVDILSIFVSWLEIEE